MIKKRKTKATKGEAIVIGYYSIYSIDQICQAKRTIFTAHVLVIAATSDNPKGGVDWAGSLKRNVRFIAWTNH